MIDSVRDDARQRMGKSIDALKDELKKIRTGRASLALFEGIRVDYYGTPTPLKQMASLSIPESRLILIQPWDQTSIGEIEKEILKSELGLTPMNDGKVIRISIPPLTEERRKELVKHVHRLAEDHKVGVREARREALSMLKDLESEGALPQDDRRQAEKKMQGLTDDFIKKIEEMTAQKEEEILQV